MVLESTVICLDNSDWMRNGDHIPSRIEAQQDAAGMICNTRTESHPENTVGLLAMAGKGVELLVSPTEDIAKILAAFSKINIGGKSDFCNAIQIAQLGLKHRKNKNGGQRIVVFVGSPIFEDKKALQKVGKQLKKNNVAIDIISMGEIDENQEKLLELVNSTNSNDNSHLITVPPGVQPVDALIASPLMQDTGMGMSAAMTGGGSASGAGGGGAAGGGNFAEYGGIDPSLDPELAMAIRVSTEEARAHEEARAAALTASSGGSGATSETPGGGGGDASRETSLPPLSQLHLNGEDEEDALLQRALELSMMSSMQSMAVDNSSTATATSTSSASASDSAAAATATSSSSAPMDEEDEDDAAMRLAMEMSMHPDSDSAPAASVTATSTSTAADGSDLFLDPAFVSQLLGSVDVDMNDPLIRAALAQINAGTGTGTGEEKEKESKKRKDGPGDDKNA
eukprot:gene3290-6518_t